MFRSLAAIIVATIFGLTTARFIEGAGMAALADGPVDRATYVIILSLGWFTGSFVSSAIALLIARRWGPVGGLAAATIGFAAIIALLSGRFGAYAWILGLSAVALGGWIALRLFKARAAMPTKKEDGLFT